MDEVCHWSELPAQVEAVLSEVWIKLDVDQQLQQAQEKIDQINNGHSEIGEIFDSVEQGLIDIENELHPTKANGERTRFYADIADSVTKVRNDLEDLNLRIDALETCADATHDDQTSEVVCVFVDSDDDSSPPSPHCSDDKELEAMDVTCHEANKKETSQTSNCETNSQLTSSDQQESLSKDPQPSNSVTSSNNVSTSLPTLAASQDVSQPVSVSASSKQADESCSAASRQVVVCTAKAVLSEDTPSANTHSKQCTTVRSSQERMHFKHEPGSQAAGGLQSASASQSKLYYVEDVIDLCDGDDSTPMDDDQDDVIECIQTKTKKTHIQDSSVQLTRGSRVLAKKGETWHDATIVSIIKDSSSQPKFKLKFDSKGGSLVSGKHIAMKSFPKPSRIHVGSRVVGLGAWRLIMPKLKADCVSGDKSHKPSLFAGIVAEVPLHVNKARYLIFFDDGYTQYHGLKNIHLVHEASDNVWEDVPDDMKEFIQEYLEKYPERPMVRLHRGQSVKTERNGVWWRAKVVVVDGSLVNVNFPNDDQNEWIYKGSPRLEPLHRELETAKYLRESGRLIAGSSVSKKRGGPCVEYQRVNPAFLVPESEILALADGKKTLTRPEMSSYTSLPKAVPTSKAVEKMAVVQWAVITLRKWCESHSVSATFEDLPNEKLAALLERFYKEGPREKPDVFTCHTLQGLRSALNTFLTEPPISRRVDILRDAVFNKANQLLSDTDNPPIKKVMVGRQGISRRDLLKLLKSGLVCLSNPLGLMRLVWLFIQPFIGRIKGKVKSLDLDQLQKKDVLCKVAKSGLPYYEINAPALGLSEGQEQRIYATGNRFYCPHHTISLYLSKLNPECPDFLQQPKIKSSFKMESVWFDPKPMKCSAISTLMADIGAAAKLSRPYNNTDIRATPWENVQEAIEDFSENLRMGYRRNPPPQAEKTSATTTTTATTANTMSSSGKPVRKQVSPPAVTEKAVKPVSQQSTTYVMPGHANKTARKALYQPPAATKQPSSQDDSDDDVIILGTITSDSPSNRETPKLSASQYLVQMSNIYREEHKSERQQTAKKSTSHQSHHYHHHKHRHGSHRHGGSSYDSWKGKLQISPRKMHQPTSEIRHAKMTFVAHNCSHQCVVASIPDEKRRHKIKKQNPLHVPSMYGWVRRLAKQRGSGRRHVVYRTPCGRSLRTIAEVDRYLTETKMEDICVDTFTFDPFVYTELRKYRVTQRPYLEISDISRGSEPVPVSLVNEMDNEQPPDVKYIAHRQPEKGSMILTDLEFLICCDCTDNCRDNSKCACRMLTQKSAQDFPELIKNASDIGYKYRRLNTMVSTGIYECNPRCSCSKQCHNRVVQNGLSLRLQVFKTDKRGWGLRCLDDIPQGAFVCTYAGQLWGAEEANRRGQEYGDEYFAELDHIEVVENSKEGYESDPIEDEGISDSKESLSSNSSNSEQCLSSDEDYHIGSEESEASSIAIDVENNTDDSDELAKVQSGDSAATKMVFRRQYESGSGSVTEGSCWSVAFPEKDPSQRKVEAWMKSNLSAHSDCVASAAEESGIHEALAKTEKHPSESKMQRKGQTESIADSTDKSYKDWGSDVDYKPLARKSVGPRREQVAVKRSAKRDSNLKETDSSTSSLIKYGYNTSPGKVLDKSQIDAFKKRTHTSRLHMRKKSKEAGDDMMKTASVVSDGETSDSEYSSTADVRAVKLDSESMASYTTLPDQQQPTASSPPSKDTGNGKEQEKKTQLIRTRNFFGETSGHVMDAKFIGNLGRYLNHSCCPNLFVQNIFVDSHDLRFPWVAFFAKKYVRAGCELTWDYNYDVGSVPGKKLICLCGSHECRGRLL